MERRNFLKSTALLSGIFFTGCSQVTTAAKKVNSSITHNRPNVIFIVTDDQGWGDLGCYGHPKLKTPTIDKLAAEGVKFESFYMNASVCSPSRAALMTGQFPSRLGLHTIITHGNEPAMRNTPYFIDPKIPMVPRFFQQTGYRTGHFGKWHLGTTRGCDVAASLDEYGFDDYKTNEKKWISWDWKKNQKPAESNKQIFDEGIRFVTENKDKPFYLQLWTFDPHRPIVPNKEMKKAYPEIDEPQKSYYSVISDIDHNVKRIVDKIEELGLSENTLFIYTSDNGPEVQGDGYFNCGTPGPFRGMKRSLYEGGIRTPMIVRWKGTVKPGQVDKTTVISGVDFLPSLTKIAGIELPDCIKTFIDGEDMSTALLGKPVKRTIPLIWDYRGPIMGDEHIQSPMMAIRKDNWKLLWNPDDSRTELYNLLKDPSEKNNLVQQHSEMVAEMKVLLKKFYGKLPQGRWKHPEAGYSGQ